MPELPEVETARRAVDRAARGKVIRSVWVVEDRIVFEGVPAAAFVRALTGRRITGSDRWGKHYWLELDRRPWPVFHFGMTGWTHVYASEAERPKFLKLELVLEDGTRIGYRDPRRIGRVRLRDTPREEPPISALGFDPLHGLPPLKVFREEFARRTAPVKAVLLDQGFSAGVGNWIADEVLYQAKIDPRRRADTLTVAEVARVRTRLKAIIGFAVKVGSDDAKFPRGWLFHYRWGKTRGAVDGRGRAIRFAAVGGRTTAWVPDVQQ
jgi:formamidopyrimidine-DNA glycosylase